MNEFKITDLKNNPILKQLLINYCFLNYEENAIIDDYHLEAEYNLLSRNNELELLFVAESFSNSYPNVVAG